MSHRTARLLRVLSLAALAVAVPFAGTGAAAIQFFTRAGTVSFTVPTGVTSLTVEAIGGRGGNLGGYGARVRGSVAVTPGESLTVQVAGNGELGAAGSGGGGAVRPDSLAAGGGGASLVARGGAPLVVAGGGGGAGAQGFPGAPALPGDGGDAGVAGLPGAIALGVAGGGGGGAGGVAVAGTPGTAGPAPVGCSVGVAAPTDAGAGQGGSGAQSADPDGFADGGGGGGGLFGGAGGGAGGFCLPGEESVGGGGGGGGSSLVPVGGTAIVDTVGIPGMTLSWTDPPRSPIVPRGAPRVTIASPSEGAVYAPGQVVRASFRCSPFTRLGGRLRFTIAVASCTGTVADGAVVDTSTPGARTFTVTAVGTNGERTERTVDYRVADRRAPTVSALRLGARRLDLGARRAWIGVRFSLDEPAEVFVRLFRGRARRAARVVRLDARAGRTRLRLRARAGRRTLRPGAYRLVLVATDARGNRSRPLTRSFSVVE